MSLVGYASLAEQLIAEPGLAMYVQFSAVGASCRQDKHSKRLQVASIIFQFNTTKRFLPFTFIGNLAGQSSFVS